MINRSNLATDLIGYLSFDVAAHRATLVVCSRDGCPQRQVALVPVGALACLLLRLAIRLGRYRIARRAIARDDGDARSFPVWLAADGRVVVSDERGERWLRSVDETTAIVQRAAGAARAPEPVAIVRRTGFDDVSRN